MKILDLLEDIHPNYEYDQEILHGVIEEVDNQLLDRVNPLSKLISILDSEFDFLTLSSILSGRAFQEEADELSNPSITIKLYIELNEQILEQFQLLTSENKSPLNALISDKLSSHSLFGKYINEHGTAFRWLRNNSAPITSKLNSGTLPEIPNGVSSYFELLMGLPSLDLVGIIKEGGDLDKFIHHRVRQLGGVIYKD